MSDYDNDTNEQIADALENLNCELVRANKIHASDDAIMIQAYKRLRRVLSTSELVEELRKRKGATCICMEKDAKCILNDREIILPAIILRITDIPQA